MFPAMNAALANLSGSLKLGLFDDTWAWGKLPGLGGSITYQNLPNVSGDPTGAAKALYKAKWKTFFQGVQKQYWYTRSGRPVIYFYNAGTLRPASAVFNVTTIMKQMFKTDFGVVPFVVLDLAFLPSGSNQLSQVDASFGWDTFDTPGRLYVSPINNSFANFMPRWDSTGRDGTGSAFASRTFKGHEILSSNLAASSSVGVLLISTWNDLGEGTGINRCYDYW